MSVIDDEIQKMIGWLQDDLKNERKHMLFYLQAAVMIRGPHRQEIGEHLLEEAQSELKHCEEFARMIVHLGGVPGVEANQFPTGLTECEAILCYAREIENEVADIYAGRLADLEDMLPFAEAARLKVFYEDQLKDSFDAACELTQMIRKPD